ncbi:MAG: hypothetical protein ACHRHE_00970 [Tepidisphaerales bacterium]
MSEENRLNPDEQAMEAALSQLRPAGVTFDAASVRLEARLRRMSRQVWLWRAAAVLAVVTGVAGMMVQRKAAQRSVPLAERPGISAGVEGSLAGGPGGGTPAGLAVSKENYFALRQRVLMVGLSALDDAPAKRGPERPEPKRDVPSWNPFNREQL